jgi:hypothetical protein
MIRLFEEPPRLSLVLRVSGSVRENHTSLCAGRLVEAKTFGAVDGTMVEANASPQSRDFCLFFRR